MFGHSGIILQIDVSSGCQMDGTPYIATGHHIYTGIFVTTSVLNDICTLSTSIMCRIL